MTTRRSLSPSRRLALFLAHEGRCHICGQRIQVGERWEVEHPIPIAMGGVDDDSNRAPAHVDCHSPKTATDAGTLAKCKRLEIRHAGIRKARTFRRPPGVKYDWKLGRYTMKEQP